METGRSTLPLIAVVVVTLLFAAFFLYAWKRPEPVLFYYGAAPEVPQGTTIAIMNPFRDKRSEENG